MPPRQSRLSPAAAGMPGTALSARSGTSAPPGARAPAGLQRIHAGSGSPRNVTLRGELPETLDELDVKAVMVNLEGA